MASVLNLDADVNPVLLNVATKNFHGAIEYILHQRIELTGYFKPQTVDFGFGKLDSDANTALTKLHNSHMTNAISHARIYSILEAIKRFALLRQQFVYILLILFQNIASDPIRLASLMEEITEKLYNEESLKPLGILGEVIGIAVQDHHFQNSVVNFHLGKSLLLKYRGLVRHTINIRSLKTGNLAVIFQKLFKWISVKIALYFFNVIHPRQIASTFLNGRKVHFPDDVEPEYLLPILEYEQIAKPSNVSLIFIPKDNSVYTDGFDLSGEFWARHMANIISILQSHHKFFTQPVKGAASVSRHSTIIANIFGSLWRSSQTHQRRFSGTEYEAAQDNYLGVQNSITFYDRNVDFTYFVCRLDHRVALSIIHSGDGSGWGDLMKLLASRLLMVIEPDMN
ncbi:hypothetical protein BATDEDRAFT_21391 [Batrachochytrium dendrobatidis JAM81]|uniref:Uncharacterized protein n=1 Tax=Batrachochytrium dendrobatidis (strain JAM81 / FGSC 10211) TaxID=684364 RepID=F4NSU6_BATDJ|nr:uncharacterized protein BATDEDRAFT_21391 [Batrachochytrium dendrobatidis JAM81]EGF83856.1 hypothetical protein BATDEDRAFT_21391 [Batrachochytrium dendrobatidis JAM81]|eukprot:XP_006675276.1 hypothetical protein BATDEDRAFT_21391 [Batrachochytrium dendrobatidis JAM81]